MKALNIFTKCIPSSINEIGATVGDVIESIVKNYGPVDECTLFELRVILNEIVLNAVKHGNREDESKLVKVHAGLNGKGYAIIEVEDEGEGYDYGCLCREKKAGAEDSGLCDFKEHGRGIMIVTGLCDQIKVNARGNRIMVVKKLAGEKYK